MSKSGWRRVFLIAFASVLFALAGILFAACKKKETVPLELSETEIEIEVYSEYLLEAKGVNGEVTWTSSDSSVVTVENGLLTGVKIGSATVTAACGNAVGTCKVRVVKGGVPVLVSEDVRAFVDVETAPDLKIEYAGKTYTPDSVKATSVKEGSEYLSIVNGKLKGVAVSGEATVKVSVTATWKGMQTKAKDCVVKVYGKYAIILEEGVELYSVNASSKVKKNEYAVQGEVYDAGAKVADPVFALEIVEGGGDLISVSGSKITAKSGVFEETTASVKVKNTQTHASGGIEEILTVTVKPPYEAKNNGEFSSPDNQGVVYAAYTGDDPVLQGSYEYSATVAGTGDWPKWGTHLALQSTVSTSNSPTQYGYLVNELGYQFITFDIYYTGDRGISTNVNGKSSPWYVDCFKNDDSVLLIKDGEITNVLENNCWLTVCVDMNKKFTAGKPVDWYFTVSRVNDKAYIKDIRYWYDNSYVKDKSYAAIDLRDRTPVQDSANQQKYAAKPYEFIENSKKYVSLTEETVGNKNVVKYTNTAVSENAYSYVGWVQSKISPVNVLNGNYHKQDYRYFSFEFLYESGTPTLYVYDSGSNRQDKIVSASMKPSVKKTASNIVYYVNGQEVDSFHEGDWVTAVVRLDVNPSANSDDVVYISSVAGTTFYLGNMYYWKDQSFRNEMGSASPYQVATNPSALFVGESYEIGDFVTVRYHGSVTGNFTVSASAAEEGFVNIENTGLTALKAGNVTLILTVNCGSGSDAQQIELSVPFTVYEENMVVAGRTEYYLYAGSDSELAERKTATLSADFIVKDKSITEELSILRAEVLTGSDVISVSGLTVTAQKQGVATLKLYFEKSGGGKAYSELITVVVTGEKIEDTFEAGGTDGVLVFKTADNAVGGREGVYEFSCTTENGVQWNAKNQLVVKESNHFSRFESAQAAADNMTAKGYRYVVFDAYLPAAGNRFYVYAPYGNAHIGWNITGTSIVKTGSGDENTNIKFYRADGTELNPSTGAPVGEWFTIAIRFDYPETNTGWSAVMLTSGGNTVYLDNLAYYLNDGFRIVGSVKKDALFTGSQQTIESILTVSYRGTQTQDYSVVSVTSDRDGIMSYASGTLTVHSAGEATLTITLSCAGRNIVIHKTVTAVDSDAILMDKTEHFLYYGEDNDLADKKTVTLTPELVMKNGEESTDASILNIEIVTGSDVVSASGITITTKKAGVATLRLYFEKSGGGKVYSEPVTVTVAGDCTEATLEAGGTGGVLVFKTADNAVGGRENVKEFSCVTTDGSTNNINWQNKNQLIVSESNHFTRFESPKAAADNMKKKGYEYVVFDAYLPTATSRFYVYAPVGNAHSGWNVSGSAVAQSGGNGAVNTNIKFYRADGSEIDISAGGVPVGEWFTVVVAYDYPETNAGWSAVTLTSGGSSIYLDNLRYYLNDFFRVEGAMNTEKLFAGAEGALKDMLTVTFRGTETEDYTVESVAMSTDGIISYNNGTLTAIAVGEVKLTITISCAGRTVVVEKTVSVIMENMIQAGKTEYLAYYGSNAEPADQKTVTLVPEQVIKGGEENTDSSILGVEIITGSDVVSASGNVLTTLKAGTATVKVYFETTGGNKIYSELITITVRGDSVAGVFEVGGTGGELHFATASGVIGGRENVKEFNCTTEGGVHWNTNNKLIANETNHFTEFESSKAAAANMAAKGYRYVVFEAYLPAKANQFIVYAPVGNEFIGWYVSGNEIKKTGTGNENTNIKFYRADGTEINPSTNGAPVGEWFTIVVAYDYPEANTGWSGVILNSTGSTVYLDNLRYYLNDSYTQFVHADVPVSVDGFTNGTADFDPKLYVNGSVVSGATVDVVSADSAVASWSENELQFGSVGETTLTVTITHGDSSFTRKVQVKVVPSVTFVPEACTELNPDAWALKATDVGTNSYNSTTGEYTQNDAWKNYPIFKLSNGFGETGLAANHSVAGASVKSAGYAVITLEFTVKSGKVNIYTPLPKLGAQGYVTMQAGGTLAYRDDNTATESADYDEHEGSLEHITVYTAAGVKVPEGGTISANTKYFVELKYDYVSGWAEVALKGGSAGSFVIGKTYAGGKYIVESQKLGADAWALRQNKETGNTYDSATGAYSITASGDAWDNYLIFKTTNGFGDTGLAASHTAAATNMKWNGYAYLTYEITIHSGTVLAYAPLTNGKQGYVRLIAGGALSYVGDVADTTDFNEKDAAVAHISVYTADGTKLNEGTTIQADVKYYVEIRYEFGSGWAEVALKGAVCNVTIGNTYAGAKYISGATD